jgi:hypothetical protein
MVTVIREPEAPYYFICVQGRLVGQPMPLVYDIMVFKELSFILEGSRTTLAYSVRTLAVEVKLRSRTG